MPARVGTSATSVWEAVTMAIDLAIPPLLLACVLITAALMVFFVMPRLGMLLGTGLLVVGMVIAAYGVLQLL